MKCVICSYQPIFKTFVDINSANIVLGFWVPDNKVLNNGCNIAISTDITV